MTGFSTRAIKAATTAPRVDQQPNSVPIYQAVSFSSDDTDELGEVTSGRRPGYAYSRIANPTDAALEARYGPEIPVLLVNGTKTAKYRITDAEMMRILRNRSGPRIPNLAMSIR